MDETFLGSKFDGRIVPRIEVRWANRTSDQSSMDESCLGSKFDGRLEVRWGKRTSERSSTDESCLGSKCRCIYYCKSVNTQIHNVHVGMQFNRHKRVPVW